MDASIASSSSSTSSSTTEGSTNTIGSDQASGCPGPNKVRTAAISDSDQSTTPTSPITSSATSLKRFLSPRTGSCLPQAIGVSKTSLVKSTTSCPGAGPTRQRRHSNSSSDLLN